MIVIGKDVSTVGEAIIEIAERLKSFRCSDRQLKSKEADRQRIMAAAIDSLVYDLLNCVTSTDFDGVIIKDIPIREAERCV